MQSFHIPSDSLYKFMAIGGLFAAALAVAGILYVQRQLGLEMVIIKTKGEAVAARLDQLDQLIDEFNNRYDTLFADYGFQHLLDQMPFHASNEQAKLPSFVRPPNDLEIDAQRDRVKAHFPTAAHPRIDRIYALQHEIVSLFNESKLDNRAIQPLMDKLNVNAHTCRIIEIIAVVVIILGTVSSTSGFLLWYIKGQRYQDMTAAHAHAEPPPS